jgi:CDP-2,3-bis-(O-geranylgeranyl)-sn-glycerol synthase
MGLLVGFDLLPVDLDDPLKIILLTLIIYFPAMAANGAPVFIKKGTPVDLGRFFIDGRRIFGDGKTYEGLLTGLVFGTGVGAIYSLVFNESIFIIYSSISSLGSLIGDMVGAFIKRRIGLPRGSPVPVLDQLGFYLFATLFIKIFSLDKMIGYNIDLKIFITGALLVFILHIATNWGAYRLRIKNVPY